MFFLGVIVGSVLSELIGLFLTEGSLAHQLFVRGVEFGFSPPADAPWLDLLVLKITLGIKISANLMSVIGIFLVAQLLRWYR